MTFLILVDISFSFLICASPTFLIISLLYLLAIFLFPFISFSFVFFADLGPWVTVSDTQGLRIPCHLIAGVQ